jgi:chromosome segregation ATPase
MDWQLILTGIGSAISALGLSEAIRIVVSKWANKKKDAVSVQDDIADLEAKDIANQEQMFTMLSDINQKLLGEIADMTQKLIDARSKISDVIMHKMSLTVDNADLKLQNELLKKENEQLKKALGELKEKQAQMEHRIKELEKKI